MRRLRERLDRLEATMRPALSDFEREFDLSLLTVDELKFLVALADPRQSTETTRSRRSNGSGPRKC